MLNNVIFYSCRNISQLFSLLLTEQCRYSDVAINSGSYTRAAVVGGRPVCAGGVTGMAFEAENLLDCSTGEDLVNDSPVCGAGQEVFTIAGKCKLFAPKS